MGVGVDCKVTGYSQETAMERIVESVNVNVRCVLRVETRYRQRTVRIQGQQLLQQDGSGDNAGGSSRQVADRDWDRLGRPRHRDPLGPQP